MSFISCWQYARSGAEIKAVVTAYHRIPRDNKQLKALCAKAFQRSPRGLQTDRHTFFLRAADWNAAGK